MKKNLHTQNQYSARIKGVKSTVFKFLLSEYSNTGDADNFKWEIIPDINYSICNDDFFRRKYVGIILA